MLVGEKFEDLRETLGDVSTIEVEYEYYSRHMIEFIEDYVKIEDKDNPESIVVPFKLWPKQREALTKFKNNRHIVVLKARQLGLSWLAIAYTTHELLFNPGKTASSISQTEGDSIELVRRVEFILRHLPSWLVIDERGSDEEKAELFTGITYESFSKKIIIKHPGEKNEDSRFKAHTSSPGAARSFTDNIVILDEWAHHTQAEEIWTAAFPTINRPSGGQVLGVSTGKRNTLFEEKWNGASWEYKGEEGGAQNSFAGVFLPWHADPNRDREWYEATRLEMTNFKSEYPATPSEAFTTGQNSFFPMFDADIHACFERGWYPPASWRVIASYDGGFNRACFKWYAISNDGYIVCYREYYPSQVTDPYQAERIRELSRDRDGAPEYIEYIVADTSCWAKSPDSGLSTVEIFEQRGLRPFRQADKKRIEGWRRLQHYLTPIKDEQNKVIKDREGKPLAHLRYTRSCSNTLRLFPSMVSAKQEPEDLGHGQEDHVFDCDRYLVMSRPRSPKTESQRNRDKAKKKKLTRPISSSVAY